MTEKSGNVTTAAKHAKNQHVFALTYSPTGKLRGLGRRSSSRARPILGRLARRKNRSVMESMKRPAISRLPLLKTT
jgi:hypothetical protein